MAFNTYPCNPWPISTEQLNKGNNDDLNTRVAALEGEVSDLSDTKANQITIAPFFDPETAYEVGELVYYNGLSYRCTNDHEGDWDADDFASTTIAGELDTLKSGLNGVNYTLNDSVKGETITRLRGNVTKISNVVTITGAWTGSATNTDVITLIPKGYRPSGAVDVIGIGTIDNAGTFTYAEYTVLPDGRLRQAQVAGAVSGGTFTFCYAI